MLTVSGLHLWRGDRHVLRGVSFSRAAGQCVLLTGKNGAGKTTLLRAIAGLLDPEEGQVSWRGAPAREPAMHSIRNSPTSDTSRRSRAICHRAREPEIFHRHPTRGFPRRNRRAH